MKSFYCRPNYVGLLHAKVSRCIIWQNKLFYYRPITGQNKSVYYRPNNTKVFINLRVSAILIHHIKILSRIRTESYPYRGRALEKQDYNLGSDAWVTWAICAVPGSPAAQSTDPGHAVGVSQPTTIAGLSSLLILDTPSRYPSYSNVSYLL